MSYNIYDSIEGLLLDLENSGHTTEEWSNYIVYNKNGMQYEVGVGTAQDAIMESEWEIDEIEKVEKKNYSISIQTTVVPINKEEISTEEFEQRKLLLTSMNNIANSMNDECAYLDWIDIIPDEATEEDIEFIACDDELFQDACKLFRGIMREYGKNGFYIGGRKAW